MSPALPAGLMNATPSGSETKNPSVGGSLKGCNSKAQGIALWIIGPGTIRRSTPTGSGIVGGRCVVPALTAGLMNATPSGSETKNPSVGGSLRAAIQKPRASPCG